MQCGAISLLCGLVFGLIPHVVESQRVAATLDHDIDLAAEKLVFLQCS